MSPIICVVMRICVAVCVCVCVCVCVTQVNLSALDSLDVLSCVCLCVQVDLSALEEQSRRMELVEEMVPEGAQRFDIAPSEVQAVMADMR